MFAHLDVTLFFLFFSVCVADTEAEAPEASSDVIYDDVASEEPLSPDEGRPLQSRVCYKCLLSHDLRPPAPDLLCTVFVCSADMIYEDVQRDGGTLERNNGWSSSEFESYDEQSDNDAKLPARSKVDHMSNSPIICVFLMVSRQVRLFGIVFSS